MKGTTAAGGAIGGLGGGDVLLWLWRGFAPEGWPTMPPDVALILAGALVAGVTAFVGRVKDGA